MAILTEFLKADLALLSWRTELDLMDEHFCAEHIYLRFPSVWIRVPYNL